MPETSETADLPDDVIAGWRAIVGTSEASDATMLDVADRYRQPHRRYHGLDHLIHVLRRATALIDAEGTLTPNENQAIVLAAWFHDAVYDPRAADNERRSADLARTALERLATPPDRIASVERLVMATRDHEPASRDEAVLLDADLAILGAEPDRYDAYVRLVRAEYAHVSDVDWRVGRADVLRRFLGAPVFSTAAASVQNAEAKANLQREFAGLGR